jgi:hypothetical protein
MSGYNDNILNDLEYQDSVNAANDKIYQYNMNKNSVMYGNGCSLSSLGNQCDFYGPIDAKKINQDSFITGRGQLLSSSPYYDVRHLPKSLFENSYSGPSSNQTNLQPMYTKISKSCNGLSETDIFRFSQLPSNYQRGYTGYNSIPNTLIQTRTAKYNKF